MDYPTLKKICRERKSELPPGFDCRQSKAILQDAINKLGPGKNDRSIPLSRSPIDLDVFTNNIYTRLDYFLLLRVIALNKRLSTVIDNELFWKRWVVVNIIPRHDDDIITANPQPDRWRLYARMFYQPRIKEIWKSGGGDWVPQIRAQNKVDGKAITEIGIGLSDYGYIENGHAKIYTYLRYPGGWARDDQPKKGWVSAESDSSIGRVSRLSFKYQTYAFLTTDGRIYIGGGEIGRYDPVYWHPVKAPEGVLFVDLSAGRDYLNAVDIQGRVWTTSVVGITGKTSDNLTLELVDTPEPIARVNAGANLAMIVMLSITGKAYSLIERNIALYTFPSTSRIVQISSTGFGSADTMMVTGLGELLARNVYFFPGHKRGDYKGLIEKWNKKTVIAASLGDSHAVIITTDFQAHTFGLTNGGRLGIGKLPSSQDKKVPQLVKFEKPVRSVSAGSSETLFGL